MKVLNLMGPVSNNTPEQTANRIDSYFSEHDITVGVFQSENRHFKEECEKRDMEVVFFGNHLTHRFDPISPLPSRGYVRSAIDALRTHNKYNLVHVYGGPEVNGLAGKLYALINNCPLIVRFNGYIPLPDTQPKRILLETIINMLSNSNRIIFNSYGQKDDIVSTYGIEKAENLCVISPGIDTEKFNFEPNVDSIRDELGIQPSTKVVGSVMTPRPVKRIDRALEIIKRVSKDKDIVYVIVGNSGHIDEYKELAEEKAISDIVYWAGHKTQSELSRWYSLFDVTILTSEWESFGMSITESYLCETPCVAFDIGGMRDQIQDGETGFLASPYNLDEFSRHVIDILEEDKMRRELAEKGKGYVSEHYSLQAVSKQYSSILSDLR